MFFYILLFCAVISSLYISPRNKSLGVFWIILLCFFAMFRASTVGTDTSHILDSELQEYELISLFSNNFSIGRAIEVSYLSAMIFVFENDLSTRLLIYFLSIVTFIFLFLAIKRSKMPYMLGVVLYLLLFYLSTYNIARQMCACSIVLYAYTYLYEESKKKYLFFVYILLATTFHASSILYLAMYVFRWFKDIKYNKNILALFATALFVVNIGMHLPVFEWLMQKITFINYTSVYSDIEGGHTGSIFGMINSFLHFAAYMVIFLKCSNFYLDRKDLVFYLFIIVFILCQTANSDVSRIFLPLDMFQILYIGMLCSDGRLKINSLPFIAFVFINAFFVLLSVSKGFGEILPYTIDFTLN